MSDDPITRDEIKNIVENAIELASLKFCGILNKTLDEHAEKQKEQQRIAREDTFEKGTGYSWANRGNFKSIIVGARQSQKNSALWRNAAIVTFIGLTVKLFWKDIMGG